MKNEFDFLHFRPLFKLPASSVVHLLWLVLVSFANFLSSSAHLSNPQLNQTHQLGQVQSFNRTHPANESSSAVRPFNQVAFLKRINHDHQPTNGERLSGLSVSQTKPNHQHAAFSNHPASTNHPTFANYHQPFAHAAHQLEPTSSSHRAAYQEGGYPVALSAAAADHRANYQSLSANVHNRIKSNIRQHHNRKYVRSNSKRREDRPTDEERREDERYSTEYNEDEELNNKKPDATDYVGDQRANKETDEENRQQNEKTDYKTDDTEDYPQKGRQGGSRNVNRDSDEDYGDSSRDSGGDSERESSRDYDERKVDDDSMHMSDEDSPLKSEDGPKEDEDSVDDRMKEDDDLKDTFKNEEDTFKKGDDQNKERDTGPMDDQSIAMKKNSVALRFLPIPKYSRPFSPKKERPKYDSIEDTIEGSKLNSRTRFAESSMGSFDERTKASFGERSKFTLDDEKTLPDQIKENSKEVNYSVFGLNPINLEERSNSSDLFPHNNFEKHEELLIELLKRRFLNNQKRMLELKKREKRRQFLNEIDESFSLRKLNQEAAKYATIERKLNRLINLIQEQQNQRELTRFTSHPATGFGSFWTQQADGLLKQPTTRKPSRSKLAPSVNLFGPNAHLYPLNRYSLSRPAASQFGSWSNELAGTADNFDSKFNHFDYRAPANYRPFYLSSVHPASYRSGLKGTNYPTAGYSSTKGSFGSHADSEFGNAYGASSYGSSYGPIGSLYGLTGSSYGTPYGTNAYQNALTGALNSVMSSALSQSSGSQSANHANYPNHRIKFPIYKFIRPTEQAVEQATSNRKLTPLNERLNSLALNGLSLSNLFGGSASDNSNLANSDGNSNNQTKTTPITSDLINSILQSATDSSDFRKLAPVKYQYRLLRRLSPSIPLRFVGRTTNESDLHAT